MIKLITKKSDWDLILKSIKSYDFYHTYDYCKEYEKIYSGKSILINYNIDNKRFILIPVIYRKIKGTKYYDITSAYGYAGPVSNTRLINTDERAKYNNSLVNLFKDLSVVSLFNRLNPLLKQDNLIPDGKIEDIGQTIAIDLKISEEDQVRQYRKSTKYEIKKSIKSGVTIFEDTNLIYLNEFIGAYNETMNLLNANNEYFFSNDYYDSLFSNNIAKARLFIAKKDDLILGGSIFLFTNDIVQYHLSAVYNRFRQFGPTRLIIDYVRNMCNKHNKYSVLHLGGGYGSSDTDSLFLFKSGFTHNKCDFCVWKWILNPGIYNQLANSMKHNKESDYFPIYRS